MILPILILVLVLSSVPWMLLVFGRPRGSVDLGNPTVLTALLITLAACGLALAPLILGPSAQQFAGKAYAAFLHLNLVASFLAVLFFLLVLVWPKAGAVALAAFREAVRQPLFWLICVIVVVMMVFIPFIPYFTFGEDHLMAKDLGLEVIMLFTVIFTVLVASMSIAEEIEGRTAVTLMSKPVSRRQFLLGKYAGILLAGLLMTLFLGWFYTAMMDWKYYFDSVGLYDTINPVPFPPHIESRIDALTASDATRAFLRGASVWFMVAAESLPGLLLGFCHVMVILAFAVALATRLPAVATIVSCLVIYILGHLSPILVQSAQGLTRITQAQGGGTVVSTLLLFIAQVFDRVLPSLQLFTPMRMTDVPIPLDQLALYSAQVTLYSLLYTLIVLFLGLILFEDRDLA